jgi:DNA-binding response OmpR family regulator
LVRAGQLRRSFNQVEEATTEPADVQTLGRLRIDPNQYRVWKNGSQIQLSLKEFKLLECLANEANKVIPLEELVKNTHGLDTNHSEASNLLRPLVRSVRRKLGYPAGDMGCIQAVRGVGYQLISKRLKQAA